MKTNIIQLLIISFFVSVCMNTLLAQNNEIGSSGPNGPQNVWFDHGDQNMIPPVFYFDGDPVPESDPPSAENTKPFVYWLHGLGGSSESWVNASLATEQGTPGFPARKAICKLPEYNLDYANLKQAAFSLVDQSQFNADVELQNEKDRERNYMIAHSQGGLVGRYLDDFYEKSDRKRAFHGLVTFGTPHHGAQIINSALDVEANGQTRAVNMMEEACNALAPAKLYEYLEKLEKKLPPFPVKFFKMKVSEFKLPLANEGVVEAFREDFCKIVPIVINFSLGAIIGQPIKEGTMASTYKIGGLAIEELNKLSTPTRKVAFYGIKDAGFNTGDMFWRTYHYQHVSPNAYGFFGANWTPEFKTVQLAMQIMEQYRQHMEYHKTWEEYYLAKYNKYNGHPKQGIYKSYLYQAKHQGWVKGLYKNGYDWMLNIDQTWRTLIGSETLNPVVKGYKCTCAGIIAHPDGSMEEYYEEKTVDNEADCIPSNPNPKIKCVAEAIIEMEKELKPSDGIVLAESAANLPGMGYFSSMPNTSHMQMRNSEETRKSLLGLFEDNSIYQGWFKLEKK